MDSRKAEIVQVAIRRFSHFGFNKTTMNEIAEDLHMTKANLYYYYSDKLGLIRDVLISIADEAHSAEQDLLNTYDQNMLDILYGLLDLRADFTRKYYVLYLCENFDLMRGLELKSLLAHFHQRDIENIKSLFHKAIMAGELLLKDIENASASFAEMIRGINIMHNMVDIVSGIPNVEKVDYILERQKAATKFIFEGKIINNIR